MEKTKVVCITPIKNEEWILKKFLTATSLWADYIIIADQSSTDSSREIAKKFKKVRLIDNTNLEYNEGTRQKLLLDEARKIPGKKLIVALDVDEFFTPNWSEELEKIKRMPEGTLIQFLWKNIKPNLKDYWAPNFSRNFGLIDDGKTHYPNIIHSERVPYTKESPKYKTKDIMIIHLAYIDWTRVVSKHRWYQCWEHIKFPQKHPIDIFRMYNHMYAIKQEEVHSIPKAWVENYHNLGINLFEFPQQKYFWWDYEVYNWLMKYPDKYFDLLPIWDLNWYEFARGNYLTISDKLKDTRSQKIKNLQTWLLNSQSKAEELNIKEKENYFKKIFI